MHDINISFYNQKQFSIENTKTLTMKKLSTLLSLVFIMNIYAFSQDTIVKKNGDAFACKIQKEDSVSVYFSMSKNGRTFSTFINKAEIATVKYAAKVPAVATTTVTLAPDTGKLDVVSVGAGVGLDYGRFGLNLMYYPQRNVGLFCGIGYASVGVGYNVGVKFRLVSKRSKGIFVPHVLAMYGFNAVVHISNAYKYNKIFYGPSVGLGFDYKLRPASAYYWSLSVLLPVRSAEVDDYITDLEDNHGVVFENDLSPIAASIGLHIILK